MRLAAGIAAFCVIIVLAPNGLAAPQVLPSSSSTVAATAADTFTFAGGQATTGTSTGTTWTLVGPSGQELTFRKTGTTTNTAQVWSLDGTRISGSAGWQSSGSLVDVPADGTWQITLKPTSYNAEDAGGASNAPGPTLAIGNKAIHFGAEVVSPITWTQYWNWRDTTGTWNEPSTVPACTTPCSTDTANEGPEEDPNNAVFFQGAGSSYSAYTLNHAAPAGCATAPTTTINGAWLGASGTTFSQFTYRDGDFTGTPDLRLVPLSTTTTEENEDDTGSGTDAKTIPYNNAAGTSYQFKVRTADQGEALGVVVFAPAMQCAVAQPSTAGATSDVSEFELTVDSACDDDLVAFVVKVDNDVNGAEDMDVTVIDVTTNTPVITWDDTQFFHTTASRIFYLAEVFSVGAYVAVATTDQSGTLAPDYYDARGFSVSRGQCTDTPTNLSPVLGEIQEHRMLSPEYTAAEHQASTFELIGQMGWLIWIITAILVQTLLRHQPGIRILIDFVLDAGILLLPMDGTIRAWLMTGGIILVILDFIFLFIQLRKLAKGRHTDPRYRHRRRNA